MSCSRNCNLLFITLLYVHCFSTNVVVTISNLSTTSELLSDIYPTLQTMNFYANDFDLDGIWHTTNGSLFTLNGSQDANINRFNGYWQVTVSWSFKKMFCQTGVDLSDCAGRWYAYDDEYGHGWYPHPAATSLLTYAPEDSQTSTECELPGREDTDCMY